LVTVAKRAEDWADFKERMHFITDFFRAYQEGQLLFDPPFTEDQPPPIVQ
jgi:hypothetical protein